MKYEMRLALPRLATPAQADRIALTLHVVPAASVFVFLTAMVLVE